MFKEQVLGYLVIIGILLKIWLINLIN